MKHAFLLCGFFCLVFGSAAYSASIHCDFNNDGHDDLAIGIPSEDINGVEDAGAVQVIYGRSSGFSVTNNQFWNADSPNIGGTAGSIDNFGYSIACGDFNGDNRDDLAIGVRGADVGTVFQGGAVTVLYASSTGRLTGAGNQYWTEDSPGILGD